MSEAKLDPNANLTPEELSATASPPPSEAAPPAPETTAVTPAPAPNAKRTLEELWQETLLDFDEVVRNALHPWKKQDEVDDVGRFKHRLIEKLLKNNKQPLRAFRQEAGLKTWLQKIANHEVNRVLKRDGRSVCIDDVPPEQFVQPPEQYDLLLRKEQRHLVEEVLPELPSRQRQVMELVLQGLTDEELARETGLKVVTVQKRKSEALKMLRELVEARQKKFQ